MPDVNVSIWSDCSVARGRRDFIFDFDEQGFFECGQGLACTFFPLPVCMRALQERTLDDISRATSPSLKTTLTWKETLSQDQGPECRVDWS